MPKHVALRFIIVGTQGTSHRIVAYEGEPRTAAQAAPDPATGLILVDRIPGSPRKPPSPLVLLQAYQSVLVRSPNRTDLSDRYDQLHDRLAKSDPGNVLVLSALAKRGLRKQSTHGNLAALSYLSKAVERGSKSPQDHMLVGELLYRSGDRLQAIKVTKQAGSLFHYIPTPYENLSLFYMSIGDNADARDIVKSGLSIFPNDPNLQSLQKKLEASP